MRAPGISLASSECMRRKGRGVRREAISVADWQIYGNYGRAVAYYTKAWLLAGRVPCGRREMSEVTGQNSVMSCQQRDPARLTEKCQEHGTMVGTVINDPSTFVRPSVICRV